MSQSQLIDQGTALADNSAVSGWSGPLFVVGMYRSGTSLLYTLLNKHPRVALMYEADLFRLRPYLWTLTPGQKWIPQCEFWNGVFQRHGINPARVIDSSSDLRAGIEQVHREYARQKNAVIWGDKSPNYYDFLVQLAKDSPDARFIVIWRDPLAICRSVVHAAQKARWFGRVGTNHRVLMGYRRLKSECDHLVRSGAHIYQLQYEDLVSHPVHEMSQVCAFLDIPFDSSMVSLEGADRSAIYAGAHHSGVKGERLIANLERAEILPRSLKGKIERYVNMWQRESRGTWPISGKDNQAEQDEPSLAERIWDQVVYQSLRRIDFVVTLFQFLAPRRILQAWREFRDRPEASPRED